MVVVNKKLSCIAISTINSIFALVVLVLSILDCAWVNINLSSRINNFQQITNFGLNKAMIVTRLWAVKAIFLLQCRYDRNELACVGCPLYAMPTAINSIVTLIYTLLIVLFTLLQNPKGILAWMIMTIIQIVLEIVWVVWVTAFKDSSGNSIMQYDSMKKWIFAIFILNLFTRVATFIVAKLYYTEIKHQAAERKQEELAL